ncbi:hypothetical protein [Haloferax sulfurifontis]|uniref:Uncharacterized protein n=1 Tax=Haloferax sulfurifontis ATCC BAA-897 TaxID=662480 RepID=M0HZD9_9EURY|nr:hypothetical protein [Haloferax sulfurifontis]ELZ89113.1 hypothetical protein C441_16499 [Haloferax sulfurifontis ATCC BAA-897]
MEVARNVRELAAVLEQVTETTGAVCELELASGRDSAVDGAVASVTVEYDLSSECAVDPDRLSVSSPSASVTDGRLRLGLDVALAPPASGDADPQSASAGRTAERDSGSTKPTEPTEPTVARADGSGTHDAAGGAPVGAGVSPPTMESAISTGSDGTPKGDRPASASRGDATEAETETSADASTTTEPAVDADAKADTDAEPEPERDAVPAHHDPVRLREVYETCETFKEMTAALGVDVTSQTVRNQMIRRGIHEPESYGQSTETTASSGTSDAGDGARTPEPRVADDESSAGADPPAEARGEAAADPTGPVDLPPLPASVASLDCSTEDVCAAVAGAKTLYEVERRLGLDRAEVRDVLTALDLLDLVTGRMARRDRSAASPADVRTRVRAAFDGESE